MCINNLQTTKENMTSIIGECLNLFMSVVFPLSTLVCFIIEAHFLGAINNEWIQKMHFMSARTWNNFMAIYKKHFR